MQEKNHSLTRKILLNLALHKDVKGIRGLACFLEEDESKLYSWINRGKIGDTGYILAKIPDINIEWLKTGKGEMLSPKENTYEHNFSEKTTNFKSGEFETPMVRNYRELAEMDKDTLGEIQTWLNDTEKIRPGFIGWFRLEFQNRFPEFDEWKILMTKKRG